MKPPSIVPTTPILPKDHGTYVCVFSLSQDIRIKIGKLAWRNLHQGYYLYVGSAFGPGGLRARLSHHLRPSPRPHWHVDYLKPHAQLVEIWLAATELRCECVWTHALLKMRGAQIPIEGFGSSDCSCQTHLVYFPRQPKASTFRTHWPRTSGHQATLHTITPSLEPHNSS